MRDNDNYLYVTVPLPKHNAATRKILQTAKELDTPLSILLKQTCLAAYGDVVNLAFAAAHGLPVASHEAPAMTVEDEQKVHDTSMLDDNVDASGSFYDALDEDL